MSVARLCGVFIPGWVGAGMWPSQQEECARAGRLEVQRVLEGETAIQHTTIIPPAHALIYTLPLHYLLDF